MTSERERLLPCPFCGNDKNISVANERLDLSGGYFIACPECDASTGLRYACGEDPRPLLIEQWNRRAALPAPADQASSGPKCNNGKTICPCPQDCEIEGRCIDNHGGSPMTTSQEAREYPPLPPMGVKYWVDDGFDSCEVPVGYTAAQVYACIDADRKARQQEALDERRLDWLDRNRASIWTQWTNHAIGVPPTFHGFSVSADDEPLPTVRAAIDAAIAKGERHE